MYYFHSNRVLRSGEIKKLDSKSSKEAELSKLQYTGTKEQL